MTSVCVLLIIAGKDTVIMMRFHAMIITIVLLIAVKLALDVSIRS
jgi:hypothetical protein